MLLGAAALALVLWGHLALLVVPAFLAWRVPRAMAQAPSRRGLVALVGLGALEITGVVFGLLSERAALRAVDVPRTEFDVEHRFLTLPSGARVHYVDEGAGDTLLFLHGNPAWSFQWRGLIAGLRGTHRCVALDYPGLGRSEAPTSFGFTPREQSQVVEEFVAALDLHDVTLVMQDCGGPIGIGFAERRPELVRGFVLGSTWAWPTTTSEPRGKFSAIMGGRVGELLQVNFHDTRPSSYPRRTTSSSKMRVRR